jgi:5'-phosphate synthase pdxT subunit
MSLPIALLALQGAFAEHKKVLESLGAEVFEIRQAGDLEYPCAGLILPGGESTVQGKLLRDLELFDILQQRIISGLPVMATCAGVILLAEQLLDDPVKHLAMLKVAVRRNAYGRQLSSFHTKGNFGKLENIPMSFIRAPQIEFCVPGVEVLAEHEGRITAVRHGNQLAMTFHPELGEDTRIAQYFMDEFVS